LTSFLSLSEQYYFTDFKGVSNNLKEQKVPLYLTTKLSGKAAQKFQWIKDKLGIESNSEVIRHLISRVYDDMTDRSR